MRVEEDVKLDFSDVLIRPKRSTLRSRADVSVQRSFVFRNSRRQWTGVPIVAANMDATGTMKVAEALSEHSLLTAASKHHEPRAWAELAPPLQASLAISSGTSDEDFRRLLAAVDAAPFVNFVCLDVANGYSEQFVQYVRSVREKLPDHIIIAGNVVTGEMVEELILSGADIVKVGIGPGSVCTTRRQTGVGYPQLSAVIECADAAHGLQGHIMSDGGCVVPGDVAKAFGAGADFVMLGGMLAGHDECGGEIVERDGRLYKLFYGMSSATAMRRHHGEVAEYRSSEGKTVMMPYRGSIHDTVLDLLGGLRSACTYVGASQLKELSKRTTFLRVNRQLNTSFGEQADAPPARGRADAPANGGRQA